MKKISLEVLGPSVRDIPPCLIIIMLLTYYWSTTKGASASLEKSGETHIGQTELVWGSGDTGRSDSGAAESAILHYSNFR